MAAAAAGLPWAAQSVSVLRPLEMLRLQGQVLEPLTTEFGVNLGPYGGLFHYLYLDVCPPSLQSPEIPEVPVAHPVDAEGKPLHLRQGGDGAEAGQAASYDAAAGEGLPDWVSELPKVPTVYVTLGTLTEDPQLLATIIEGARQEPVNVVVTVGNQHDPESLGHQPDNVHVERYIPQSLLLPHCNLVVNHAGSVLPVLGHGLPLLMAPQKGNEFHNADACVACGAGRRLPRPPEPLTSEIVREEIRLLLEDLSYRQHARRVAAEIALMPGPEEGVRLLEQLARERQPLVRAAQSSERSAV